LNREVNVLLRFESLDSDFAQLCSRLGIPSVPLPRRNASSHDHYSRYYDTELIEAVRSRFREEIDLGRYTFERA
jgi:hypothetical protein